MDLMLTYTVEGSPADNCWLFGWRFGWRFVGDVGFRDAGTPKAIYRSVYPFRDSGEFYRRMRYLLFVSVDASDYRECSGGEMRMMV